MMPSASSNLQPERCVMSPLSMTRPAPPATLDLVDRFFQRADGVGIACLSKLRWPSSNPQECQTIGPGCGHNLPIGPSTAARRPHRSQHAGAAEVMYSIIGVVGRLALRRDPMSSPVSLAATWLAAATSSGDIYSLRSFAFFLPTTLAFAAHRQTRLAKAWTPNRSRCREPADDGDANGAPHRGTRTVAGGLHSNASAEQKRGVPDRLQKPLGLRHQENDHVDQNGSGSRSRSPSSKVWPRPSSEEMRMGTRNTTAPAPTVAAECHHARRRRTNERHIVARWPTRAAIILIRRRSPHASDPSGAGALRRGRLPAGGRAKTFSGFDAAIGSIRSSPARRRLRAEA